MALAISLNRVGPALAQPRALSCHECHKAASAKHIRDWMESRHAWAGVQCGSCHEGAEKHSEAALERSKEGSTRASGAMSAKGAEASCGRCHARVKAVFELSKHHGPMKQLGQTPRCVDCHTSAGGRVLDGEAIVRKCGSCHRKGGGGGRAWIPAKSVELLSLLRQIVVGRVLVQEEIRRARQSGRDTAGLEKRLYRLAEKFRGIAVEWHRFRLREMETRGREVLRGLESLHRDLDK